MFNTFAHAAVDAVQSGKKQFVNASIQHDGIRNALNSFVDSQTEYTKKAIDAGLTTATNIGMIVSSKNFFDYMTESFKSFGKGK